MAIGYTLPMHQVIIELPGEPERKRMSLLLRTDQKAMLERIISIATKGVSAEDEAPVTGKLVTEINNSALNLLDAAAGHMRERAAVYDKPEGERSMGKTVEAFNIIAGRDLTESEGWLLMQILKDVRDRQRKLPHVDSLEDCIAYSALKAEARLKE
jgi:hypothetical protein